MEKWCSVDLALESVVLGDREVEERVAVAGPGVDLHDDRVHAAPQVQLHLRRALQRRQPGHQVQEVRDDAQHLREERRVVSNHIKQITNS